jgi:histidinol phosphatase-like PHP family hydrolase
MPIKIALVANPRITLNPESSSSRQACPEAIYLLRRLVEYLGIREDVDLLCIIGELLAPAEEPQPALTALKAILDKASFPVLMAPAHGTAGAELCLEIFGKEMFRDLNGFRVQACDFPPEKELSLDSLQAALDAAASPSPAARKRVVILPTGIRPTTHPGAFSPDVLSAHNIAAIVTARSPAMADEPNLAGIEALDDFSATPYSFALLSLADGDQAPTRQDITLRLPLPLRDLHTHSHFAYCNDDLDLAWESRLMDAVNLSGTAITEHSGHLVFCQKEYWGKHWYPGDLAPSPQHNRTAAYRDFLAQAAKQDQRFLPGLEIDIDQTGRIIVDKDLLQATRLRIGAVHFLSMAKPTPDTPGAVDEFMRLTERLITSGLIQVLAHPFRVFSWDGAGDKPTWVFDRIVKMLKQHNVAAEVNFHHNRPDPVFTRKCLDAGVKISLGSDAHSLYKLGAFLPHLDFLRQIGYDGDWRDILINAKP